MMKVCTKCNKQFSARSNLSRHLRSIHGEPPRHSSSYICPLCDHTSTREKFFLDHLRHDHDLVIEERGLTFDSEEDFYKWKISMEKDTSSFFTKGRSKKDERQKTMYFNCNRSGIYSPKQERKRRIKSQGSRKMNRTCPAKIIVTRKNCTEKLSVYFIPTHIGHQIDLKHLNLHKEDRLKIARNLEQGVDKSQLLSKIKESIGASGSRLNLLTIKDLRNIKERCHKSLSIASQLSKKGNDPSSNSQSLSHLKSPQGDVMIDGEINMDDESTEFFDSLGTNEYDSRRKLVDNIMESLNAEIPLETLNNIKELINASKIKKPVLDVGVKIQHSRTKSSSSPSPSSSSSQSSLSEQTSSGQEATNYPVSQPHNDQINCINPSIPQAVSPNPLKQRKILPKPQEAAKISIKTNSPLTSSVQSPDNYLIKIKPLANLDSSQPSQGEALKVQLIDSAIDTSVQLLPETCYVILPSSNNKL